MLTTPDYSTGRDIVVSAHTQPESSASDELRKVASAMSTAAQAARDGAGDAIAKAREAGPAAREMVSKFVYSSFYYLSYGVVFPTMLVANFIPGGGPIASGLVDGAAAASEVIGEIKEKSAARKAARAAGQADPITA